MASVDQEQAHSMTEVPAGLRQILTTDSGLSSGPIDREFRINTNVDLGGLSPVYRKSCVLFYAPETEALARKVAAENSNIKLAKCRWRKFPDGFPVRCGASRDLGLQSI